MKSWRMLLTMLMVTGLARPAQSWQVPSDPYAQPPAPGSGGFRFGSDPNQAPPTPQPMPGPAFGPPPLPGPPTFAPPPSAPPAQYPGPFQPQPPVNPPPPAAAPRGAPVAANPPVPNQTPKAPLIPGFDPALSSPNAPALQGSELFQPSQIVATVGNQYIQYGDASLAVELMMRPELAKARTPAEREAIEAYRPRLMQQAVRQLVEQKILYVEFEREMEKKAGRDKIEQARKDISKRVGEGFKKQLFATRDTVLTATPEELHELAKRDPIIPRLAILMKENQCENLNDLDLVLRDYGSSIEKQQQAFSDYNLGRSGLGEVINKAKSEISHLEMVNYYREHAEDFAVKAKARFEIITVKFTSFPNKEAAYRAIAQMGNDIFYGTPFAAVARKGSQDPNAEKGGVYGWTNENSLASEVINKAIFSIEPNRLSPILEDERGFHILRVTEREAAGYVPFTDAQVQIKKLITQKRQEAAYKDYVTGLRNKTNVWTIYDDPPPAANVAAQPPAGPMR